MGESGCHADPFAATTSKHPLHGAEMKRTGWLISCALVCGCAGEDGDDGMNAPKLSVDQLPVGNAFCPVGGVKVSVGDQDHYICDGRAGEPGAAGKAGDPGP